MGITYLILVIFQVVSVAAIATLWVKINKIQNQEDQRLSKGLQLLQSKLAVLEDLSDRTEVQVNQLVAILEGKIRDIQSKLIDADKVIMKVEQNIAKSLEVANIFQDKIPHQEILERQYTKKYVKAAQLAHGGLSIDEIAQVVDLTRGEIELIVKLNREKLQFDLTELPEWAKGSLDASGSDDLEINVPTIYESRTEIANNPLRNLETAFEVPQVDNQNLKKLGDQFRSAMAAQPQKPTAQAQAFAPITTETPAQAAKPQIQAAAPARPQSAFSQKATQINNEIINTFAQFFDAPAETKASAQTKSSEEVIMQGGKKMTVKPFEFRRIEGDANT